MSKKKQEQIHVEFEKYPLTHEEKENIIKELAERFKDTAYMKAEEVVRMVLDVELKKIEEGEDFGSLKVRFAVEFTFDDAKQIISRCRRQKKKS